MRSTRATTRAAMGAMCSTRACLTWLLVCVRCASSIVPAPANVSVVCKNFQTVVSWTYSQQLLADTFKVSIRTMGTSQGQTETEMVNKTRYLQYDLSKVVWASLWSSRDAYTVSISALSHNQESTRSTSPRFTFNELHGSRVQILCTLDLPPVELLVSGQLASMSFQNPMKSHPELQWSADIQKSDPLILSFDVTEDNVTHTGRCSAHEQTCSLEFLLLYGKEKHCVSLKASLTNDIHVMKFNQVDLICGHDVPGTYGLLLALLLVSFVLVVCTVVFMVWKSKACVRSTPPLPKPLVMDRQREEGHFLSVVDQDSYADIIQVDPDPPSSGSAGSGTEDSSGEDAEVELEVRDYDRPHDLQVDMGAGDIVQGYGP